MSLHNRNPSSSNPDVVTIGTTTLASMDAEWLKDFNTHYAPPRRGPHWYTIDEMAKTAGVNRQKIARYLKENPRYEAAWAEIEDSSGRYVKARTYHLKGSPD